MKSTNHTRLLVSLLSITLLAACDNPEIKDLTKKMSKELEVKVTALAKKDDDCARVQLIQFVHQYKDLKSKHKKAFKEKIKAYKEIVINPTEASQRIVGEKAQLALQRYECTASTSCSAPIDNPFENCGNYNNNCVCSTTESCGYTTLGTKDILDTTRMEGELLETQLDRGETLTVRTQVRKDEALRTYYTTESLSLYDGIDSEADDLLKDGVIKGDIQKSKGRDRSLCGPQIKLSKLVE